MTRPLLHHLTGRDHLVPLVRAGAIFIDGKPQERKEVATEGSSHPVGEEYAAA
jgi:hypothetical protein